MAAAAGEDRDACRFVGGEGGEGVAERAGGDGIDGVALCRTVDGDDGNGAVAAHQYGHVPTLPCVAGAAWRGGGLKASPRFPR